MDSRLDARCPQAPEDENADARKLPWPTFQKNRRTMAVKLFEAKESVLKKYAEAYGVDGRHKDRRDNFKRVRQSQAEKVEFLDSFRYMRSFVSEVFGVWLPHMQRMGLWGAQPRVPRHIAKVIQSWDPYVYPDIEDSKKKPNDLQWTKEQINPDKRRPVPVGTLESLPLKEMKEKPEAAEEALGAPSVGVAQEEVAEPREGTPEPDEAARFVKRIADRQCQALYVQLAFKDTIPGEPAEPKCATNAFEEDNPDDIPIVAVGQALYGSIYAPIFGIRLKKDEDAPSPHPESKGLSATELDQEASQSMFPSGAADAAHPSGATQPMIDPRLAQRLQLPPDLLKSRGKNTDRSWKAKDMFEFTPQPPVPCCVRAEGGDMKEGPKWGSGKGQYSPNFKAHELWMHDWGSFVGAGGSL